MLNKLNIGYNGQPLLDEISFSIYRNTLTAILGENGSGKSTLLKTLLGLILPVSGRIESVMTEGRLLVFGYVPQSIQFDQLYPLTCFDVALMGVYGRISPGHPVPETEYAFTHECLSAAGCEEFSNKRFAEVSGGQKQRVLIARALTVRPDILMLDEPTSGLDHAATYGVMDFINNIREERKIAVMLVTHDFVVVRRYAEQIIWLNQGKILQGTAQELLTPKMMAEILEREIE